MYLNKKAQLISRKDVLIGLFILISNQRDRKQNLIYPSDFNMPDSERSH